MLRRRVQTPRLLRAVRERGTADWFFFENSPFLSQRIPGALRWSPTLGACRLAKCCSPSCRGCGAEEAAGCQVCEHRANVQMGSGSWEAACAGVNNLLIIDSSGTGVSHLLTISPFRTDGTVSGCLQWKKPLLPERGGAAIGTRSLLVTSSPPDTLV